VSLPWLKILLAPAKNLFDNGNAPKSQINPAEGGAILNHGNLTLTNDQFVNNHVTGYGGNGFPKKGDGGAILSGSEFDSGHPTLTIKNSLFDSNTATGGTTSRSGTNGAGAEGGAICLGATSGAVSITASTFTNNQAIAGNSTFAGGEGLGGSATGGAIQAGQSSIPVNVASTALSSTTNSACKIL
jgi:hypothetical protein